MTKYFGLLRQAVRCGIFLSMSNNLLTTDEAASLLNVSSRRVRAMIAAGILPAQTTGIGNRATHLFARADLKRVKTYGKAGRPKGSKNKKPAKPPSKAKP
jgi:excisionase family DNA binding protein